MIADINFNFFTNCIIVYLAALIIVGWTCVADPQTNLLKTSCHYADAINPDQFFSNLNATFVDLRRNLSTGSHFATATRPRLTQPVFALFQCRQYLATADCISCLETASAAALRTCGLLAGATFHYDGCFLRYEYVDFFAELTTPGQAGFCVEQTVPGGAFNSTAADALSDLAAAVPTRAGFFAEVSRAVSGGGRVYAVGECRLTVGESGCRSCLSSAVSNVDGCLPAVQGRGAELGCFMRYSDQAFFNITPQFDLDIGSTSGGGSNKTTVIAAVCAAVGAAVLMSLLAAFFCCRRSKHASGGMFRDSNLGLTELRGPTIFPYQVLKGATRNFDEQNKLGAGGFGSVYKGVMSDGTVVAVKKLTLPEMSRVRADFDTEVRLISNIRHRNLVRLLGCCNKGPDLILVYEFMPNGSLDKYLFGEKRGSLDWNQRMNIILGMARGLVYLHEEFPVCIIHRDIKSSNILLDNEFNAQIADFGLARLLPSDRSHLSTRFAGTLGYTAPEYAIHGQLTVKVDTYSFGLVVLEIVSGRRTNSLRTEPFTEYLLEWAWRLYESESLMDLVDKSLDLQKYDEEEVKRVIEIGLMCTQSVSSRPIMSEVIVLLRSKQEQRLELQRPTFINDKSASKPGDKSTSTESFGSNATISLTRFTAR